jgi:hypothetical protein
LGDTGPGGGKVFYVQAPTAMAPFQYLEAAPNNWSGESADIAMDWCNVVSHFLPLFTNASNPTDTETAATSTTIGSGFRNTKVMLANCASGAANAVALYNGGGKIDWFLPSKDELSLLITGIEFVGGFQMGYYYSSTEASATEAWVQYIMYGTKLESPKVTAFYFRPIRAF